MQLSRRIALATGVAGLLAAGYFVLLIRPNIDALEFSIAGREIELLSPRWLGLVCLLPYLWLVHSLSLVDLSRHQRRLSLFLRTLLVVGMAIALARPATTSYERRTSTVFLVDVSASVSDDQLQAAWRHVDRAWRSRGANEMHVMAFAAHPTRVPLSAKDKQLPQLKRPGTKAAREHSDLQAALQHAYGLFRPDRVPRIVLLTDGNETRGDIVGASYQAAQRKVPIHVVSLPERKQREVLVRSLSLPKEVRIGAPFHLVATIDSTHTDRATLTLYKDGLVNGIDGRKVLELKPGMNRVKFKAVVREAGLVSFRLLAKGLQHDTWAANNTASVALPVLGRPRVLYVEGEPLYASYLERALESERIDVEVRGPHGVPSTAAALAKFDLLVLSDVPATHVGDTQMGAIESYVRDFGGGFIMTGGPNSFGAGGYYRTRIAKILPVELDTEKRRDQPSVAILLCIDRSGSMSGPKIELAKEAAKATSELLSRSDLIGVVAFDSSAHVIVRLQRAANRLRILNDIARLTSGGGTNIKPALQEAFDQLQPANAKVKHVILLSDGQSSYGGIPELVDEMAKSRITVSAVGVGGGADRTLLQMIAERGNGRFYHTNDANNIPKIFTKETTQVARSAVVEELVKVHAIKRAHVLKGIDIASAPYLRGYVSTKAKRLSETILVSEQGEPILTMWRVGLGKAAAFTSDVKNRWAVDWLRWPGYTRFWAQVVREMMRHRAQRAFNIDATVVRDLARVTVDAIDSNDRFINGLTSEVTIFDPRKPKEKQTYDLPQVAAGRYQTAFSVKRYGAFLVRARHRQQGKLIAESLTSLSVPYPKEYTSLLPDETRLRRAAQISGGAVDPSLSEIFSAGKQRIRYHKELWSHLLYVVLFLFLLDVLLRRVRLFGHREAG